MPWCGRAASVAAEGGSKMRLAQDEHVVKAFSAHAPEEALADGVGVSVLAPVRAGLAYRRLQLGESADEI